MNQEINFIPDFGAATNGIASTVTWELEGTNPLRCEGIEADPGKRQEFFDGILCSESVAQTSPGNWTFVVVTDRVELLSLVFAISIFMYGFPCRIG